MDARPWFGRFFVLFGLVRIHFFMTVYKTSVPSIDGERETHNIGLLNTQMNGVLTGAAFLVFGGLLYAATGRRMGIVDTAVLLLVTGLMCGVWWINAEWR